MTICMNKILSFIKKRWTYIIVAIIALIIGSSSGPSAEELDKSTSENEALKKEISSLKSESNELLAKNKELEKKVEEAAPYFKLEEQERKNKEAEAKAKAEELKKKEEAAKAKKEAEEKAKEEAAKKKAEEKEKQGYETGITYNQLARKPDDYIGEKVKFSGKVIQVIEDGSTTQLRLAVNDDYDTVLFAELDSSLVDSRILEDDQITIMGLSSGLITYESTMGGNISIPSVSIEKVEQ